MAAIFLFAVALFSFFGNETLAAEPDQSAPGHGWLSVLPALIAIALSILTKNPVVALVLGIWCGAWTLEGFSAMGLLTSLFDVANTFVVQALAPPDGSSDHMFIVIFSLLISGMMGIITKNGGMAGLAALLTRYVRKPRGAQLATAGLGGCIFFDDYANILVVGNAMRGICDKLRVSREKLAYLVDSTSAPVATLAIVSTWIGFQVSLLGDGLEAMGGADMTTGFALFFSSLAYNFYPILALVFLVMVAWSGRDFGPMLHAEQKARQLAEGPEEERYNTFNVPRDEVEIVQSSHWNAILPILTLLFVTLIALYTSGEGDSLIDIIGSADPFRSIMGGSMLGTLVAVALTLKGRLLNGEEIMNSWIGGMRGLVIALVILTLAWALSDVNAKLGTADYILHIIDLDSMPYLVPLLVFLMSAGIAFATGTSWGTMAVAVPLVFPLAWKAAGLEDGMQPTDPLPILYASVASILAGSVWGDHCSPVSDSTIMSSMASGCNHMDHFYTQVPYALLVGGVSALNLALLPLGLHPGLLFLLSIAGLYAVLRVWGKRVEEG